MVNWTTVAVAIGASALTALASILVARYSSRTSMEVAKTAAQREREAADAARQEEHRRVRQEAYVRLQGQLLHLGTPEAFQEWSNSTSSSEAMARVALLCPESMKPLVHELSHLLFEATCEADAGTLTDLRLDAVDAAINGVLSAMREDVRID